MAVPLEVESPAPVVELAPAPVAVMSAPAETPPQRAAAAVAKILRDPFERRAEPDGFSAAEAAGAPALAAAERAPAVSLQKKIYLLSKPAHTSVSLGWLAMSLHYAFEVLFQVFKAGALFYATGHLWPAAMLFVWELPRVPISIAAQSMADLKIRFLWRRVNDLKDLAKIPGVERIKVLTTNNTRFSGPLAVEQTSRGFVFLESARPPEAVPAAFGGAVLIEDPVRADLRFELVMGKTRSRARWSPNLAATLAGSGAAIPEGVLRRWRRDFARYRRSLPALKAGSALKDVKVEVSLKDAAGNLTPFGSIGEGPGANKLLGLTWGARALRWTRIHIFRGSRGVSLGNTEVAKADPSASWPLRALRALRRLLGRLVEI